MNVRKIGLGLSILGILACLNAAIWQKEQQLAQGEVVRLALAPADPRSLMQGDYMRLNFVVLTSLRQGCPAITVNETTASGPAGQACKNQRHELPQEGYLVVKLDHNQVGQWQRLDHNGALTADERRLHFRLHDGQPQIATDAWFIQEGTAAQYEKAQYGEFRIDAAGNALLTGLLDAQFKRLGHAPRQW